MSKEQYERWSRSFWLAFQMCGGSVVLAWAAALTVAFWREALK